MTLKGEPPKSIRERVESSGIGFESVLLSVATDINSAGDYDPQWLIVTAKRLFVFDPALGDEPLTTVRMEEVADFRVVSAVGSGLLQVEIEKVWLDLIRFSNRLKFQFDRVLKRLQQVRRGETPDPDEADEKDPQRCPRCGLMLEFPGELCPRCISHGAAFSRVAQLLLPYWKAVVWMLALLLAGTALDMAWPLLTRYLVDYVLTEPGTPKPQPYPFLAHLSSHGLLISVVGALAGVQIFRALVNVVTGRISSRVGNAMTYDIRGRLVSKLEELGLAYYNKQETGSVVGRVAYDTEAIQGFIGQVTSGFVMQFLLVLISFAMMMSLEPSLALWSMLPAPFVLAGAIIYWRYVHPRFEKYWDRSSKQAGLLNGILTGIRVVKAFGQEQTEFRRFQRASGEVRDSRTLLDRTAAYFYPLMAVVFQVGGWLIWYIGGGEVLGHKVSLGTLMAFFGYLSMFYGPLGSLTNLTTWLTQFSTQMHRIFEILNTPTVLPVAEEPEPMLERRGKVEFKDVVFGYTRGSPVLKDLNLLIRPGERIGIVGRSGAGKTSLVNLICRFYDVESGSILIDNVDVRKISKQDLRAMISVVLQEPFLFRGTLLENITYGARHADLRNVIEASRSASAHDFIMNHRMAYDSSVGERGQELSGGERQRVSIARALLVAPPILILDEATSAIDSESEQMIQGALDEAGRSRTMIIIAHRLSTLQNCDRIYVVDNGGIAESGTHRELMEAEGNYARWVRIQQGKTYVEMDSRGVAIHERRPEIPPGGLPPIGGFRVRWLRPDADFFERGRRRELQLYIAEEGIYRGVFALRCFPVHRPEEYISLRFVNHERRVQEIGMIEKLSDWPELARELVHESLARRYYFHTVRSVRGIRKFGQYLSVHASTDQGRLEFILRAQRDSVQDYGSNGRLLIDVEDNLYLVPDLGELKRDERELFTRHIYW